VIYTLETLRSSRIGDTRKEINGRWAIARPEPGPAIWRWRAAWAVFRGRADAFTWPEQQAIKEPAK